MKYVLWLSGSLALWLSGTVTSRPAEPTAIASTSATPAALVAAPAALGDCTCSLIPDQEVSNEQGPCGLMYNLANLGTQSGGSCTVPGCAPNTTCQVRVAIGVTATPYTSGECTGTAAIKSFHPIVHTYSIDCQSEPSGNHQWSAAESISNPNPQEAGHRFGLHNMTCGTGYGTSLKIVYECPCPEGGGDLEWVTPERHMKCKKCCP